MSDAGSTPAEISLATTSTSTTTQTALTVLHDIDTYATSRLPRVITPMRLALKDCPRCVVAIPALKVEDSGWVSLATALGIKPEMEHLSSKTAALPTAVMVLLAPSGKQISLHQLMAMSTMLSPTHNGAHIRPIVQAGGGDALSEIPPHQLYLSHAIQDHLRRVYTEICKPEIVLSKEKFAKWLVDVQGSPIEDLEKDEYKFEEFLEAVYYSQGFEAVKVIPKADKDLSRPITNYFISSSHNTYLSGNQLASKSSTESYKNVLIRGCRCIEIDVHNGTPAEDSKSPESISSSTFETVHKRHKSGSTLSSLAAATLEKAEEKYNETKTKLRSKVSSKDKDKDQEETEERGRAVDKESLAVAEPLQRPASVKSLRVGEPIVMHGWTLTSRVGFRAVCRTIAEVAFEKSDLPIIVSLEVHADTEQQEVMVDIMKEEWKGLLIDEAHEACNPEERLPNLDELKNKILIKVKKAAEKPADLTPVKLDQAVGATLAPIPSSRNADSGSDDERSSGKKKLKICDSLSNLGIYTHSEHFVSFEAKSASKPPHVFSIGENQIMELHEHKRSEMFAHNRSFFMRAYPSGIRVDSSNLDPSGYWRKGVQMVALNWQKLDEGMMLNEAMFSGEQGWVLKPPGYRSDPSEPIEYKTLDLRITIYAGQHIPLPPDQTEKNFHPYVKCELHVEKPEGGAGEPIDGRGKEVEYKQKTAYCTGDHPDFGKEGVPLLFPQITMVVEQLSFVRFKIEDAKYAKDELAAWACIRLDRLQTGYRFVQLFDAKGQATAGLLFIKIEKKLR